MARGGATHNNEAARSHAVLLWRNRDIAIANWCPCDFAFSFWCLLRTMALVQSSSKVPGGDCGSVLQIDVEASSANEQPGLPAELSSRLHNGLRTLHVISGTGTGRQLATGTSRAADVVRLAMEHRQQLFGRTQRRDLEKWVTSSKVRPHAAKPCCSLSVLTRTPRCYSFVRSLLACPTEYICAPTGNFEPRAPDK